MCPVVDEVWWKLFWNKPVLYFSLGQSSERSWHVQTCRVGALWLGQDSCSTCNKFIKVVYVKEQKILFWLRFVNKVFSLESLKIDTSLVVKGALNHRLQRRTVCKIQNGCQGAPKWRMGSGKVSSNFHWIRFLIWALLLWEKVATEENKKEKRGKKEKNDEKSGHHVIACRRPQHRTLDHLKADRWNAARSCQKKCIVVFCLDLAKQICHIQANSVGSWEPGCH